MDTCFTQDKLHCVLGILPPALGRGGRFGEGGGVRELKITPARTLLLRQIREMQSVSEARLGVLKGPTKKTFQELVQKGLNMQAEKGMLGITKRFWMNAEVMSGRERGGAFYSDLIETGTNGKIAAKIACTIRASELGSIRSLFKAKGMELVLTDGLVVGFQL